jgi:hypothetical protein
MKITLTTLVAAMLLGACIGRVDSPPQENVEAYVPVYASTTALENIEVTTVRSTTKAGKIYAYGNYIFQNELYEGIHIIDRSQAQPKKIAFLKVPFSTEVAVKGNYLYTNSVSDVVVFDITNPLQPTVVKRMKNAFPAVNQEYPPFSNVFFECVDPAKGIVVDWVLKTIPKANCRR